MGGYGAIEAGFLQSLDQNISLLLVQMALQIRWQLRLHAHERFWMAAHCRRQIRGSGNLRIRIIQTQHPVFAQCVGAMQDVFKFPHISCQVVVRQLMHEVRANLGERIPRLCCNALE